MFRNVAGKFGKPEAFRHFSRTCIVVARRTLLSNTFDGVAGSRCVACASPIFTAAARHSTGSRSTGSRTQRPRRDRCLATVGMSVPCDLLKPFKRSVLRSECWIVTTAHEADAKFASRHVVCDLPFTDGWPLAGELGRLTITFCRVNDPPTEKRPLHAGATTSARLKNRYKPRAMAMPEPGPSLLPNRAPLVRYQCSCRDTKCFFRP